MGTGLHKQCAENDRRVPGLCCVGAAGTKQYYMRTLHVDYRAAWVASINDSIATFNAAMAKAKQGSSHPAHASQSEVRRPAWRVHVCVPAIPHVANRAPSKGGGRSHS